MTNNSNQLFKLVISVFRMELKWIPMTLSITSLDSLNSRTARVIRKENRLMNSSKNILFLCRFHVRFHRNILLGIKVKSDKLIDIAIMKELLKQECSTSVSLFIAFACSVSQKYIFVTQIFSMKLKKD